MDFNKKIKIFKRNLARWALFFSAWIAGKLPLRALRAVMGVLMAIAFQFIIKQRRIAQESLTIAFGNEKSPQEINRIVKDCFENLGEGMVEMLYFLDHPQDVFGKVSFEGQEHLDRALKEGNGAIAVTAHFGNFPLMMLYCALSGYPTNAIIRPARDQVLEEYLLRKRIEIGLKTVYAVPRKDCVSNSLKVLRNNELLFIPLDQNFGSDGGVFVDFFGQKAATATGPIIFALRTKAPILPMFIVRQKGNQHKIIIESPLILEELANEEGMILVNTAKITKLIEQYIRRYPHEWGWMHRRWKSRPAGVREGEAKNV